MMLNECKDTKRYSRVLNKILLVFVALTGCAVVPDDSYYTWYKQGEELKEIKIHKVSKEFIKSVCGHNEYAVACTLMNFSESTCDIYSTYEVNAIPEKILNHEMKHCKGLNHIEK